MKKIISTVFGLLLLTVVTKLYAQSPLTTLSPSTFTANDQITITTDVTGTPMAGATTALLWIWCYPTQADQAADASAVTAPGIDAGGSWSALSSDPGPAMMTNVSGNIWTFTFTPVNTFGLTPGSMYSFNYLVRSVDGNTQTSNAIVGGGYKFVPLVFIPTELRVFPAQVDTSDVVSVNFDQSLATVLNDQRMSPDSATITAYDDEKATSTNSNLPLQIGNPITIPVKNVGGTIWAGFFIPSANFPTTANGHNLGGFTFHFDGTILDVNGNPAAVTSIEYAPVFTFTPMK